VSRLSSRVGHHSEGLPVQDLMHLGGWTDPTCPQTIYQQPDWGDNDPSSLRACSAARGSIDFLLI